MEKLIREKRKILAVMLSLCVLFYFILTILLPVTYVRRFSVLSLVPDSHVIECYVPGKAIETILSDHLEKSEITYSPQGDGTLVKIETQTAELLGKIEIGIQFIPEDKTELLTNTPTVQMMWRMRYWNIRESRRFLMCTIRRREEAGAPPPQWASVCWGLSLRLSSTVGKRTGSGERTCNTERWRVWRLIT